MSSFLEEMKQLVLARIATMQVEATPEVNEVDFASFFHLTKQPCVIAEVKLASPSRGDLYFGNQTPVDIAQGYMQAGAMALSVLTEPHFFKGDIDFIRHIRAKHPTFPILLKDFVLDPIQIKQARVFGANSILLIAAFLDPMQLQELHDYALTLGLTPLVEVHNEVELEQALAVNAKLVGINNRNLKTLGVDLNVSRHLIQMVPDGVLVVCESGIRTAADLRDMSTLGFDGFLIGTQFMKQLKPGAALGAFMKEVAYAG